MDYLKYAQCFYMVKHLSRFIQNWAATYGRLWSDFAIVLGGDLNSLPHQSVMGMLFNMEYVFPPQNEPCALARHQYLRVEQAYTKLLNDGKLQPLANQLLSAYQDYYPAGRNMAERHPHTIYGSMFRGTIDYILYNPGALSLVSVLRMPEPDVLKQQGFLPSRHFPSDHLRIEAAFHFNSRYQGDSSSGPSESSQQKHASAADEEQRLARSYRNKLVEAAKKMEEQHRQSSLEMMRQAEQAVEDSISASKKAAKKVVQQSVGVHTHTHTHTNSRQVSLAEAKKAEQPIEDRN